MDLKKTTIVGTRAYTLSIHAADNADVYWQPLNTRTGRPWQAKRAIGHYEGKLANMRALQAFNRCVAVRASAG